MLKLVLKLPQQLPGAVIPVPVALDSQATALVALDDEVDAVAATGNLLLTLV